MDRRGDRRSDGDRVRKNETDRGAKGAGQSFGSVRFARREGVVTSPPFRGVALKHGDEMDAPEFPLLA